MVIYLGCMRCHQSVDNIYDFTISACSTSTFYSALQHSYDHLTLGLLCPHHIKDSEAYLLNK